MQCLDADTVLELVGGDLPRQRAAELAAHLDGCSACRRIVSETAASLAPNTVEEHEHVDDTEAAPARGSWPTLARDPGALPIVQHAAYLRLDEVARGGLGRIVRAQDLRTGRMVAIKEMLAETPDAAVRFVREALVTANLQHPAIVPVYEVGRWPDGQPFYAMKLVRGRPLSEVIDACNGFDERLALMPHVIAIADALAYAHGEGVIHRDLKPHNVLVGAHGETVVIDWGLARRVDAAEPSASANTSDGDHTVVGSVLGTPAYMAPEQARGERVGESADVYAIGAILYRALAGRTPFTANTSAELIERVKRGPPQPLAELAPNAPRDLIAIVERAMAREPGERYPSASQLVGDLRRFTTGQLVRAYRYTALQRARRFVARHRTAVAVGVIAALALATVGVVSVSNIVAARNRADEQRDEAHRRLVAAYVDRARVELAAEHADRALAFAAAAADLGDGGPAVQFVAARALDALPEVRRFRATDIASVAFVPGMQDLIVASSDGIARWRAEGDATIWKLPGASAELVMLGAHEFVARRAGGVAIVSADDGHVISVLPESSTIRGTVITDTAKRWLAFATSDRGLALYDLATRQRVTVGAVRDLDDVVLVSPDGTHIVARRGSGVTAALVVTDRAGTVTPLCNTCFLARAAGSQLVWVGAGADGHGQRMVIAEWTGASVREIALSPDGLAANLIVDPERGIAVVANSNGTLGLYVLATGLFRGTRAVRDVPYSMLFEGSDRLWVLGLYNGLTAFDLKHGLELGRWRTEGQWLARSDDGVALATATGAGVSWWRVPKPPVELVQATPARVLIATFTDDGALITGSADGAVAERDARGAVRVIAKHAAAIEVVEPVARGMVLVASRDGEVVVWQRANGSELLRLPGAGSRAAASPDGLTIATGDREGHVALWDRASTRQSLGTLAHPITAIRWTRDGNHVAAIDQRGAVRVWTRAGTIVRTLDGVDAAVAPSSALRPDAIVVDNVLEALGRESSIDLAFSPDGRWLARACPGCSSLHEVAPNGRDLALAQGPELREPVLSLAFSHDGSRVLLASSGFVRTWNTATGALTTSIATNTRTLAARFSSDDRLLFTGGMDNRLRVWDAETGAEYTRFDPRTPITSIAISADGGRVAATTANAVMLWTLSPLPEPVSRLRAIAACRTGLVFEAGVLAETVPVCGP